MTEIVKNIPQAAAYPRNLESIDSPTQAIFSGYTYRFTYYGLFFTEVRLR